MKKFYFENKIFIRVAGVALFLFITAFICFYGQYDLFRIPFDSGVWGTASDWTMILVTSFTLLFLVKSLKAQSEANTISYKNYKKSIRPYFTVFVDVEKFEPGDKQYFLTLKVNENNAFDIEIDEIEKGYVFTFDFVPTFMSVEQKFSVAIENRNKKSIRVYDIKIATINFKDNEGNRYFQDIYVNTGNNYYATGVEDKVN